MKNAKLVLLIIFIVCLLSGCTREPEEPPRATTGDDVLQVAAIVDGTPEYTPEITEPAPTTVAAAAPETTAEPPPATTPPRTTAPLPMTAPPRTAAPATTAPPPVTAPPRNPGEKLIALTFDDGPGRYTQRILDALERYGGRATFFVIGMQVWNHRDTMANIVAQGSEVAGHSWHHYNLTRLSEQEIRDQIAYTDNAIYSATGRQPPRFLRPPYGAHNYRVQDTVRDTGHAIILWNMDPRDWQNRNADLVYAYIMERAHDGAIILAHDIYRATAEAMERVIPALVRQGYRLVTVSELLGETRPGHIYFSGHRSAY